MIFFAEVGQFFLARYMVCYMFFGDLPGLAFSTLEAVFMLDFLD